MNLYFLSEPIKKILDSLERFREQLQKDEDARVEKRRKKALIKRYPQFTESHIEQAQRGYNPDFDKLCQNMLDDRDAKWSVSHYHMHYNGKHGKISLWICNFPYASHHLVDDSGSAYPNNTGFTSTARCGIETMIRFHEFQKTLAILSGYDIMSKDHHEYVRFDNETIKVSRYPRKAEEM